MANRHNPNFQTINYALPPSGSKPKPNAWADTFMWIGIWFVVVIFAAPLVSISQLVWRCFCRSCW